MYINIFIITFFFFEWNMATIMFIAIVVLGKHNY